MATFALDDQWLLSLRPELAELALMPPRMLRSPAEEYLIDTKFLNEPILPELAILIYETAKKTPAYIWQIIAAHPRSINPKLQEIVHEFTWFDIIKKQKRMLVDRANRFDTSVALRASFPDYVGSWTESQTGWDTFVSAFRTNLAKAIWRDTAVNWQFPLCRNCKCDDPAFLKWRDAPYEQACLEKWLRKWVTSNNVLTYTSPFPELQAKICVIKKQNQQNKPIDPTKWMSAFKEHFPKLKPNAEILETEDPDNIPTEWLNILSDNAGSE